MLTPRTIASRPSLTVFLAEPILFGVWSAVASRQEDLVACMASALPQAKALKRCALIVAFHRSTPLPGADVRAVVQAEMKKMDPYLVCGATVLSQEGLAGTAMRAVTSTLQLLSRPTHPEKIVASGKEAAVFVHGVLAKLHPPAPSIEEILAAYEQVTKQTWSVTFPKA